MQISEHSVRERAYYIWEDEGRVHGRATAHWVRAEAELRAVAAPVAVKTAPASAKVVTRKAAAKNTVDAKRVDAKAVAGKAAAAKPAAKPAAPKVAKASKAAVTAGLAAKAKATRAPVALH